MPQAEINPIITKNQKDWDAYSEKYLRFNHSEKMLRPILDDPSRAFHAGVWALLRQYMPDLVGKRVLVPSSGDNLAVFAFARMGARVTSCDISINQLEGARRVAERNGLADSIEFLRADTMRLDGVASGAYDLTYTSNGVHVWLNDLPAMYRSLHRALKPGGTCLLYEIHPFLRPFDDALHVVKPYDSTGPFEDDNSVTFAWRVQDILNALMDSGIRLVRVEELFAEKNYDWPFWVRSEDVIGGLTVPKEEVDRMYDWRVNPAMALPNWLCAVGRKP